MSWSSKHTLSLPKGGGAIQGIGETFQPSLFSGTGNFSVPVYTSPGREGFGPQMTLQYSTGNGNGIFGLGWDISLPSITRKTENGLPIYRDEYDVFILSGSEDLVPFMENGIAPVVEDKGGYSIQLYRPRTEGLFAKIEKWCRVEADGSVLDCHWRATTKDNITTIYGKSRQAKVENPGSSTQIYKWLIEETYDAKGNHIYYEYAQDGSVSAKMPSDANRAYCQKYIRRIYYCNIRNVRYADGSLVGPRITATSHQGDQTGILNRNYAMEVVFDYGDFSGNNYRHSTIPEGKVEIFNEPSVPVRADAFSVYRSGFELRTTRLCRRVLMYHHFKDLGGPTLVKSTDFDYAENENVLISFLVSVKVTSYRINDAGTYENASFPAIRFTYSEFKPHEQHYQPISAKGGHVPSKALNDPNYGLFSLYGDSLPDVTNTSPAGILYWKNLGNGSLDVPKFVKATPAGLPVSQSGIGFSDPDGDGKIEVMVGDATAIGFFEIDDGELTNFKPYSSGLSFNINDPNVRQIDLTGNGLPDVLMTTPHHFIWWENRGEDGFSEPQFTERVRELDKFPDIYFNDERVRLADMTGDGLTNIVLLHNGRIDYWPNLGYGKFGKRITLSFSPLLEYNFDPKRLFLADLDGTGCADLVYVDFDKIYFWFNQSGNAFSERHVINGTPYVTDADSVQFNDFFGNGTSCLIWSYPFNFQLESNYKVLDFCGDIKPYLLIEMDNGLGAITKAQYASSTKYYLNDLSAGNKWVTPLPFPLQVLAKSEVIDIVSRTKAVTTYKYHHGYYDGKEREFRGFGRVDEFVSEEYEIFKQHGLHDASLEVLNSEKIFYSPVIETRNWYHTGAYAADGDKLMESFKREFYKIDENSFDPGEHAIETGMTPREAFRAMRGALIRSEVYSLDSSDKKLHPYTVTENVYSVKQLQERGNNRHAAYYAFTKETFLYNYERNPADPRVAHQLTLDIDHFGNILKSASIYYPRRNTSEPEQNKIRVLYTEKDYCEPPSFNDSYYRVGANSETRTFEITGLMPLNDTKLDFTWVLNSVLNATDIGYTAEPTAGAVEKRLIKRVRNYFWKDDLSGNLGLHLTGRLGLPYDSYSLAFTRAIIDSAYRSNMPSVDMLEEECKYIELDASDEWWKPTGIQEYSDAKFYLPIRVSDALGNVHSIEYDDHDLLQTLLLAPLGNNTKVVKNDYRILQAQRIEDINGNFSEVAFDIRGFVVATSVYDKAGNEGDSTLNGYSTEISDIDLAAFKADPKALAIRLLGGATSRMVYDLHSVTDGNFPIFYATISREIHVSEEISQGHKTPVQVSFSYSDGLGREIQKKVQAEPGLVEGRYVDNRWVGSGFTIFNNHQNPVQQYEPFFTNTSSFEFNTQSGVTPTLFYDPLQRVVATLFPNHTYSIVVFDAWSQATWDANDTILLDPRNDPDFMAVGKDYLGSLPTEWGTWYNIQLGSADRKIRNAALQTEAHASTPKITELDVMGRPFLTIDDNGSEGKYTTRTYLDIEGNILKITDPKGIEVFTYAYDLAGRNIVTNSKDAGRRSVLYHAADQAAYLWDANGNEVNTLYDELQRPTEVWVTDPNGTVSLVSETVYGEAVAETLTDFNLRGKVYQNYDGAGLTTSYSYDFKGNLIKSGRRLLNNYGQLTQWPYAEANGVLSFDEIAATGLLLDEEFIAESSFDAVNRVVVNKVNPADDDSITTYYSSYNEAGFLDVLEVQIDGSDTRTPFVSQLNYNEKGQRLSLTYGNGVQIVYTYDSDTFRLVNVLTKRTNATVLQDLYYVYDPVGNVTAIEDKAIRTVFNRNQRIDPIATYTYDAVYRLIKATGREHESMNYCYHQNRKEKNTEYFNLWQPITNGNALLNYTETYRYDESGNNVQIRKTNSVRTSTRNQTYESDSNRILTSSAGCAGESGYQYRHDANGNIVGMPHLNEMIWNYANQLVEVETTINNNGTNNRSYYQYSGSGQRVCKINESNGLQTDETLYLGALEIYRRYDNQGMLSFQRNTLHVSDGSKRIALVEIRKEDIDNIEQGLPVTRIRYQLDNHLGSSLIEVDDSPQNNIITIEEYYPFGGTSYLAGENEIEAKRKRYRYSGKERDDETGFYYYGARYYASWLARWCSCDPLNKSSAPNLYSFVQNKSTRLVDPNGLEDLEQSFADIDLTEHNDPSKSEIYNKLKDKREHAKPLAKPMTQEQARKESAKAQKKFRKEQGMKGSEVQAGHTSAVRDAAESGIRSEDLDKDMQQLHSRKGKGLDVDVTDQQGNVRTTTRHRTQEGIIDEATEKVRKATPDGKLTPQGQLDAAAEVRWRTENIPLDQRDVERVRKGGQAAVEAAEDANKGRALLDEAMKKSKGLTDVADEVVKESGKGAKVMAKLGKAGRRFAAAIPIAGAVLGHASAAHAAASGDVTGAALDEAGNIPIAGDLLDAARGGYALGEAINEGLVPESTQMAIGGAIFNAAEKLGFNPIDW